MHDALVVTDVLLGGALEGDLGAHDRHEHTHLVCGLDLVTTPLDLFRGHLCDDVVASLEQQRDAVREAVDRETLQKVEKRGECKGSGRVAKGNE